jgi:hypothetical protein
MHPESFMIRLGDRCHHLLKSTTGACFPNFGEVNDGDGRAPDMLVEEMVVIVEDAVADERDIVVSDQRPEPFQVGEHVRTAPRCERQVERRDLTVRLVVGMQEVGVT